MNWMKSLRCVLLAFSYHQLCGWMARSLVARSSFSVQACKKCPMKPVSHRTAGGDVGFLGWCFLSGIRSATTSGDFMVHIRAGEMGFVEGWRDSKTVESIWKYMRSNFIFLRIHMGIHTTSIETVQGAPTILYSIVILLEKRYPALEMLDISI